MDWFRRLRDFPGVLYYDLPRYRSAFSCSGDGNQSASKGWISLCNRIERVSSDESHRGVYCNWKWGSDLHATNILPSLGKQLMRLSLEEWPIHFSDHNSRSDSPDLSFIFSHAGEDRLPLLRQTIRSIFGQKEVSCEVIVVDQSVRPIAHQLPQGVRYQHLAKTNVPPGWHKAWGFNVGARQARGRLLVFQDGDVCAPAQYGREILDAWHQGKHKAFSIQRFLYYLSESTTQTVLAEDQLPKNAVPERVFQNWKGGTIAVEKDAYWSIGGFDEGFVDWGGEDDEFYDRCLSINHLRCGYIPFIHLWHAPQPDRKVTTNPNIAQIMPWRMALPHSERIAELTRRNVGSNDYPDPIQSYKSQLDSGRLKISYNAT